MNEFNVGKTTAAVIHFKVKVPKKDGTYPVKFRITHDRVSYFIASGFSFLEDEFNRLYKPAVDQRTGKTKKVKLTRDESNKKDLITAQFQRIKTVIEEIYKEGEYSHEKLKNKLKGGRGTYIDVAFDNKIAQLNKQTRVGSAAAYETAKKFIGRYKPNVEFVKITPQWLEKFEDWAINTAGVSKTTLGIYLRALRALFNDAIRNGDIPKSSYPFQSSEKNGYKIPKGEGTKIALSIEQFDKIAKLDLAGSLQRCRDMFLLSFYLGGINFKDLLLLKWRNIANGEVHFIREKTRNTMRSSRSIKVPLIEPALKIIDKWGNDDKSPESFVINHLSDDMTPQKQRDSIKSFTKQVNDQLKEIGKRDDIQIDGLSSMVARHSFATILKNSGAPIAFIGETLGHTSTKTTESYLKSFESEQRRKHFDVIANIGSSKKVEH